ESEGGDSFVSDYTGLVTLVYDSTTAGVDHYHIDVPTTAGPLLVSVTDPFSGGKDVLSAIRQDGKILPESNAWFRRTGTGSSTQYLFELFDLNGGGRYDISFGVLPIGPKPPVLQVIPDYEITTLTQLGFLVKASDPNGTIPKLTIDALPAGATFTDHLDGTGVFNWTPAPGQEGEYPLTFRASDGALEDTENTLIKVLTNGDIDSDGLPDDWEQSHFGNLNQGPGDDFDGDGLTNQEELDLGTDPTSIGNAPSVPTVVQPQLGTEINTLTPTLIVSTATHGVEVPLYQFEVSEKEDFSSILTSTNDVTETPNETSWTVDQPLKEDTFYFWRARAVTGEFPSEWVYGKFFVNVQNN
ncbi:MAG: hypothetical protein KDD53_12525, partial [Bdellovibrionales bacterium]|nr:hypothetical protein [Bdellovibrionales bacterium]